MPDLPARIEIYRVGWASESPGRSAMNISERTAA